MTDADLDSLAPRLAAGDERAYATLFDRLARPMVRVARGLLGRHDEAEDVVQEVFLSLVRSRRRLRCVENIRSYVFTALRRTVARRLSQRGRPESRVELDEIAAAGDSAVTVGEAGEIGDDRVDRALHRLPSEQREVVLLKIDGELTFAEIGHTLGIPPNTAASRYRYALEKLRAALEPSRR